MDKGKSEEGRGIPLCDPNYTSSHSDSDSDASDSDRSRSPEPKVNTKALDGKPSKSDAPDKVAPSFAMTMKSSSSLNKELNVLKSQKTADQIAVGPFKLSLSSQKTSKAVESKLVTTKVAKVFNDDEEADDTEEMPPEAKMRMRNLGKDTPTAAGPNSFSKGKMGFSNAQKVLQRELEKSADEPKPKRRKF